MDGRNYVKYIFYIIVLFSLYSLSIGRFMIWDLFYYSEDGIKNSLHVKIDKAAALIEWYIWPNIITDVFCGFLIDNLFGIKWSLIVFSMTALLGHILMVVGLINHHYMVSAVASLLFGIGCEALFVAQLTICSRRFFQYKLALHFGLIFGLNNVFIMIGYALSLSVKFETLQASKISSIGPVISVILSIILYFEITLNHERYQIKEIEKRAKEVQTAPESYTSDLKDLTEQQSLRENDKENVLNTLNQNQHTSSKIVLFLLLIVFTSIKDFEYIVPLDKYITYRDGKFKNHMQPTFVTYYTYIICFPVMGYVIERYNLRKKMVVSLIFNLLIIFINILLILTYTHDYSITFITLISICATISQLVLWSYLPYLIPSYEYGTMFGLAVGSQNIISGLIGRLYPIIENNKGYTFTNAINGTLINIAIVANFILVFVLKNN